MSKIFSKKSQSKMALNKNNSSNENANFNAIKDRSYIDNGTENRHISKSLQEYSHKERELFKLYENNNELRKKLVNNARYGLCSVKKSSQYYIDPEDMVSDIIKMLLEKESAWDIKKYPDIYNQVMYFLKWDILKKYDKADIINKEKNINDFTDENLYQEGMYDSVCGDLDIKRDYQNMNDDDLKRHNKYLLIKDWYDNKANPFQRAVIDLKLEGLKDQGIAAKLKAPVKNVYNVLKNNKGKFKDLEY